MILQQDVVNRMLLSIKSYMKFWEYYIFKVNINYLLMIDLSEELVMNDYIC